MDLRLSSAERMFRSEVRAWLEANPPGEPPGSEAGDFSWRQSWQRRQRSAGYIGLTWPAEFGGRGGSFMEQAIFDEEAMRVGMLRPLNFVGLQLVGPSIIRHGTEWQKERFLAPILNADEFWCQGFSEPEAGSDLASLTTRGVKAAGGWRIYGQKLWTSLAHLADYCILLARTDPTQGRHRGLTYFVLDMRQSGVELRRLRQANGNDEFNEVFLDGAWVPDQNVIGAVGEGWTVATTTLMYERVGLAFAYSLEIGRDLGSLVRACREAGLLDDSAIRAQLAKFFAAAQSLRLIGLRALTAQADGRQPGPEGSIGKLRWAQVSQELAAFALDVLGDEGISEHSIWSASFLRSRSDSIKGGTSEIQANIIADRVLGLPRMSR